MPLLALADTRAQAESAGKALELQTLRAFFQDLRDPTRVDPRLHQWFRGQSSGWRVPWSVSASEDQVNLVKTLPPPPQLEPPVLAAPAAFARLGRARRLR